MVEIKILSADVTGLLDELCRRRAQLFDIRRGEFEVTFSINSGELPMVEEVTDRRGDRIKVLRKSLHQRLFRDCTRHPVLILGILGILALSLWLPTRIFFVQVEGNDRISTAKILECSDACGISFGAVRSEIRNEEVKNYLLDQIPELQWVGVNTRGCVARITVKERQEDPPENDGRPAHMVASCDAVVRSCTVSRGTALCKVGQAVRGGELLISGYTDCEGLILHTQAEGEIYGETNRQIMAVAPEQWHYRGDQRAQGRKISLRIGKNQINFFQGSGILDGTCVKMEREYKLTLPGGFALPISMIVESWYRCDDEAASRDTQNLLTELTEAHLRNEMIAGQILHRQLTVDGNTLYGNYVCLEMIGRLQYEENTIDYGKSDGTNSQR